jgi:hypothetical protein
MTESAGFGQIVPAGGEENESDEVSLLFGLGDPVLLHGLR